MAAQIAVEIKARWWLRPAMAALLLFAHTTSVMPSDSVIDWLAKRAVRYTVRK